MVEAEIEALEHKGYSFAETAYQKTRHDGKIKVFEALRALTENRTDEWSPSNVEDVNSVYFVWELEDYDLDDVIMTMEEEDLSFVEAYHQLLHLEETIKETEREREDY